MTRCDEGFSLCPPRLRKTLQACAAGELTPDMAFLRLAMDAGSAQELSDAIGHANLAARGAGTGPAAVRLAELGEIARGHPQAWQTVATELAIMDDVGPSRNPGHLARLAEAFDRAARFCPEASVALYSLGEPARLAAATAELADMMRHWGFTGRDRTVLDIGCGIGRMEQALAQDVEAITGIDISPVMIEEARRRCSDLGNVIFQLTDGRDLADFGASRFDAVIAIDSFPYLVDCGLDLARTHIAEATRVLKPGGDLLIVNFSYRGDFTADRTEVVCCAARAGLGVLRNGDRVLETWDGAAFHLAKSA